MSICIRTQLCLKLLQVWDWLFKSYEVNGRILLRDGLITIKDIEECIVKGNCKKLCIKLQAWSILQCLLTSVKADAYGIVIGMYFFPPSVSIVEDIGVTVI